MKSKFFGSIFFLIISSLFLPKTAWAAEVKVDPAYTEVVFDEQTADVERTISLTNTNDQPLAFEVFAVEVNEMSQFGSLTNLDVVTSRAQQVPYIQFDASQFSVPPNQTHDITMTVENRSSLRPGGNYLAIVIRSTLVDQTAQQPVLPAIASFLIIRKTGGEIRNLSLVDFSWPHLLPNVIFSLPQKIDTQFTNQGNVHVIPRGTIEVTDLLDRVVAQGIVNDSSLLVLPGRNRQIQITLKSSRPTGPVSVLIFRVTGRDSEDTAYFTSEKSVLYIHPMFLFSLILVPVGVTSVWLRKKRSKKKMKVMHLGA